MKVRKGKGARPTQPHRDRKKEAKRGKNKHPAKLDIHPEK